MRGLKSDYKSCDKENNHHLLVAPLPTTYEITTNPRRLTYGDAESPVKTAPLRHPSPRRPDHCQNSP